MRGALELPPQQSHSQSAMEVRRPLTVKQAGLGRVRTMILSYREEVEFGGKNSVCVNQKRLGRSKAL